VASRAGNTVALDLVTAAGSTGPIDTAELLRKRDLFEEEFGCALVVTFGAAGPARARGAARGGSTAPVRGRRLA
jgi:hypothetical protein